MADKLELGGLQFASFMQEAEEAQIGWIKQLVYGPSGSGKTSLLATMPDPLIVLLTEQHGQLTIKRVNPKAKIVPIVDTMVCTCHLKPVKQCDSPKGTRKLRAAEVLYGTLDELATKTHPFVSVALDSLTDLQQILLWDMKGGKPGAQVSLQEWGKLIDRTKDLVSKLRNLNMHTGVICLSDEVQDNNQRMIQRPALAGKKLPGNLIQYFNLCAFQRKMRESSATDGAIYESVFDAGPEYYTKTHPALNPIEPPNMRLIIQKIIDYAAAHGEGDMPTASSPVSPSVNVNAGPTEDDKIRARMENPKIKELFDKLQAPQAKREATLKKYRSDEKVIEVLGKKVEEMEKGGEM